MKSGDLWLLVLLLGISLNSMSALGVPIYCSDPTYQNTTSVFRFTAPNRASPCHRHQPLDEVRALEL
jgi:hypothetical protein